MALCLLSSVLCLPSSAQFALDWWTIDGGGGTSTGGVYALTGTIGQSDAGPVLSGGPFTVVGGFWSLIAAVQTPGAPWLKIRLSPTNSVIISWTTNAVGFSLQQTAELATPDWQSVPTAPVVVGDENQVVVPYPQGKRFYRLKK